jgi:alpha-maltose-1-phosphate synthase
MNQPTAININISSSGSKLGGAAIAAEFHSRQMAESFPVELWRMWDDNTEIYLDQLKVVNFESKTKFDFLNIPLPRKLRSFFLESNISEQIAIAAPKIIHLHNPLPGLAFEKIVNRASQAGIKIVTSTHGFYEVINPNYGLKWYEKWMWEQGITKPIVRSLQQMSAVFSGYPAEKDMLINLGVPESKIYLAPNGVNPFFLTPPTTAELDETIDKFNLRFDRPILLFIGNHSPNKGLDTIMKLASQLSSPCTIVVGGRLLNPDEPQQWKERFLPNQSVNIIFTDYLTTIEQRALYRLSDILLFPSLADTLPLTIIEAMATELPVIAYDVGGISYQLQDGCGILVKTGDFTGFLAAVEQLIFNPNIRTDIAEKAKLRQETIFSWEKTANITIDVYKQIIGCK